MVGVVTSLTWCKWGTRCEDFSEVSPSWATAEAALDRLNGREFNDLYFRLDDGSETYFAVAGGPALFLVFLDIAGERFHEAIDSQAPAHKVELVVGGQHGTFDRRDLIDRPSAIVAFKTYFETGKLAPSLSWRTR